IFQSGTFVNGTHCIPCHVGHYCPSQSNKPQVCPSGTFANETGSVVCKACPAGYACLDPSTTPAPCGIGEYSINGQSTCTKCPDGSYSAGGSSRCVECPAGQSCMSGSSPTTPQDCAAGTYSPPGFGTCKPCQSGTYSSSRASYCSPCPTGYTCTNPAQVPQACPTGQYWTNDATGPPSCSPCPAGYKCENASQPPVPCGAGYYSAEGNSSCTQCIGGQACPDPTKLPISCPSGTFSDAGATYCTPCPAGSSCPTPSSPRVPCTAGTYSLEGVAACVDCPVGYMCPSTSWQPLRCPFGTTTLGASKALNCTDCPAGYACTTPENNITACNQGEYSLKRGARCITCPAGSACAQTDSLPVACNPGQYSDAGATSCSDCAAGWYCPNVASSAHNKQCPAGTYSTGNKQSCMACPVAKYCPKTNESLQIDCPAGTYSTGHLASCISCPSGWQCPNPTGEGNTVCLQGTYSIGGQASCTECPPGVACPDIKSNQTVTCAPGWYSTGKQWLCTPCDPGYKCPSTTSNAKELCPVGTYSTGAQAECTECPAGYSCPSKTDDFKVLCYPGSYTTGNAQVSFNQDKLLCILNFINLKTCITCPAGHFCPNISSIPIECEAGKYSLGSAVQCTDCPAGSKCPNKDRTPEPCEAGKYSNRSMTECVKCSPGYICRGHNTSPTPISGLCPVGSFCPDGAVATPCPSGTYGNTTGASSQSSGCQACPPGYFCPEGTIGYPTRRLVCPAGHFCLEGTKTQYQNPCPAGKFSRELGLERVDQCLECKLGFYCPSGDRYGDRLCPPGHYCGYGVGDYSTSKCPAGTYQEEQGSQYQSKCKTCPPGYYCLAGSATPIPCPTGTFNPWTNQGALSDCKSCTAGMACPEPGLTRPPVKCSAGYYCPAGSILPNATRKACPAGTYTDFHNLTAAQECTPCPERFSCQAGTGGYFCPLKTISPTQWPCAAGSWSNLTNLRSQQECYECPKGSYCLRASAAPSGICHTGHYCPPGEYSGPSEVISSRVLPGRTLTRREMCGGSNASPASRDIIALKGPPYPQSALEGHIMMCLSPTDCKACVPGYYCPNLANVQPTACGIGNFSASGASLCTTCQVGFYCPSETTSRSMMISTYVCPAGLHCPTGSDRSPDLVSNACYKGHYCLRGDEEALPQKCPNGTFNPNTGRKHVSECQKCWKGYYCEPEGREGVSGPCPPGYYCEEGTGYKYTYPCPIGFYRNASAAISVQDCSVCSSGFYCDDRGLSVPKTCTTGNFCPTGTTIPQPCPSGYYNNATGVKRSVDCTPCPAGRYCAGFGATEPTGPCDAGFYCRERAYTSVRACIYLGGLCPAGGYCPMGAKVPSPCPVGTYSNTSGAKAPEDCISCDPGYYCAGDTNPAPTGPCSAGYYCTGGAKTPTQFVTSAGHYSEKGAASETECPVGTYQSSDRASKCIPCLEKNYCDRMGLINPIPCPTGHYCPAGSTQPTPCWPGSYSNSPGQASNITCQKCDAGYYCSKPGMNATEGLCQPGYYCRQGSPSETPDNGNCTNDNSTGYDYGGVCPPGYYCLKGTREATQYPCPNGTYNDQWGRVQMSECLACPGGKACTGVGLKYWTGVCRAGHYCKGGSTTPTPDDGVTGNVCPIGKHCPTGSSEPKDCAPGTFSNTTGLDACLACPAGYYCRGGVDGSTPFECPKGHYCPESTGVSQPQCPPGTYNPQTKLRKEQDCWPCKGGKYCEGHGAKEFPSSNSGDCAAGFYCVQGVNTPRPSTNFSGIGGVCPPGAYCPLGTAEPIGCPNGTFSNVSQLESAGDCTLCSDGMYCEQSNLTSPTGPCAPGFYCKRGSNTARPSTTTSSGGPCTAGHFCPEGTSVPKPCRAGTYNPKFGEAECFSCMEGYYCPEGSTDYSTTPCPEGHYCPNGTRTRTEFPCPKGYFNNRTHGQSQADCLPCPGGSFCDVAGLSGPTGLCDPGYFCVRAAWQRSPVDYDNFTSGSCLCPSTTTGGVCQPGFFCPGGSHEPTPCTGGKYCQTKGLHAETGPCDAGFYCTSGARYRRPTDGITGDICPPGRYCEQGTKVPELCPQGTFSNNTGNKNVSYCFACTGGYYCQGQGKTEPTGKCDPGFYCPGGDSNPTPYPCTKGHYCPKGTSAPVKCPSGSYQDELQKDSCKVCPEGHFCDNKNDLSDYTSYICPKGYYCPNGTEYSTQYGCPPGYYGNATKLHSASQCLPCPPGNFCVVAGSSDSNHGDCHAGFHCILGSSTPTPNDNVKGRRCPEGRYCVSGTKAPENCPQGTFSNSLGLPAESNCTGCTPGMYCNGTGLTEPSGPCWPRYFCSGRATHPAPQDGVTGGNCTAGHYCPGQTPEPIPCEDGSYMKDQLADACIPCPAGSYCVDDKSQDPRPCPLGYYCPQSTGFNWKPCLKGTYGDSAGLANITSCRPCGSGKFCAYDNATSETGPCRPGYYCRKGADTPTPGYGALGDAGPCPEGHFCPGSTGEPEDCPIGTYSNVTHLERADQCEKCGYGHYCSQPGITEYSGQCDPGFYCLRGSESRNPPNVTESGGPCPKGHYCPRGTSYPLGCVEGTYNDRTGQEACTECCAGFYCPSNSSSCSLGCPTGHYCPNGTKTEFQYPCPRGTFNNQTGQQAFSACEPCLPGKYCGSEGLTNPSGDCAKGFYCVRGAWSREPTDMGVMRYFSNASQCYCSNETTGGMCQPGEFCPEGSQQPTPCTPGKFCYFALHAVSGPCDPGHYCTLGAKVPNPTDNTTGGLCWKGHFCESGTYNPSKCPIGSYSPSHGNRNVSDCVPCLAGQYCESEGLDTPTGPCDKGYYCPNGQSSKRPSAYVCTPGHYCTEGSPVERPCASGSYQDEYQRWDCKTCPEGYYCDATILNATHCVHGVQLPTPCVKGHYCTNGTTTATEHPCPAGTGYYRNITRGESFNDCMACPGGHYCNRPGLDWPNGLCDPGYYCTGKSDLRNPDNITVSGGPCPPGHFCPVGSPSPLACPGGNYQTLWKQSSCDLCDPGYFCPNASTNMTSGLCVAGYYCNGSTVFPRPENQTNGDRCPKGHFCPTGSSGPQPCWPGTYADTEYNQFRNNCKPCIPGMYCPTYRLSYPSGNCSEGYYCPAGETKQSPPDKQCQPGHYCPEGSGLHRPCPPGSYQPFSEKGICLKCPPGMYCDPNEARVNFSCSSVNVSHGTITPSDCPAGFYCPNETEWASQHPCPVGTFGNSTKLAARDQCTPCTKGHYCATEGKKFSPTGLCHAGYYCIERASVPNPNDTMTGAPCPPGYYCNSGFHIPAACPRGTYGPKERLTNLSECVECPGGQAILKNPTGEAYGNVCPAGHYCPIGTTTPFKCPPGTFNNKTKGTHPTDCSPCPPGQYCEGYGREWPNGPCDPGFYCSRASYSKRPLPSSGESYNNSDHFSCPIYSVNSTGAICPSGTYCPHGASQPIPCDPGKFCGHDGLAAPQGNCTAGFYCNGSNKVANPVDCAAGHYCPSGTPIEVPCPTGTFSPDRGNTRIENCQNCTSGYYCPTQGATSVIFQCMQGYYCPSGSIHNDTVECPLGFKCPTGVGSPVRCDPGFHQDSPGQWACKECPAGFYCDPTGLSTGVIHPVTCTPGNYCPKQTGSEREHPCPRGSYSNETGLEHRSSCKMCPPKMYCGSEGLTKPTDKCSAGYLCFINASVPNPTDALTGDECPMGFYCPQGSSSPTQCEAGTFGNSTKLKSQSECNDCSPGFYCSPPTIYPNLKCSAGHWCSGRSTEPSPVNKPYGTECPNGTYCPEGTPVPVPCPKGSYNPYRGKAREADCVPCEGGKYCETTGLTAVTGDCKPGYYCTANASDSRPVDGVSGDKCPIGHYCPEGSPKPYACANGTFMNHTGAAVCYECPAGSQCIRGTTPDPCPQGRYCLSGTGYDTQPCPVGTFGKTAGLASIGECTQCTGGYFCQSPGMSTESSKCAAGFYCTSGVNISEPTTGFSGVGGICPPGHECPEGSPNAVPCLAGFYAPHAQMAACKMCPQGFFCNGTTITPTDCPAGHYCPNGTRFHNQFPCQPGTFNNLTGQPSVSACKLCPAGSYCAGYGRTSPNGPCDAGFYCSGGSWSNRPGDIGAPFQVSLSIFTIAKNYMISVSPLGDICPAGHYCPEGSEKPRSCDLGSYCARAGLSTPSDQCTAGFFCNESSTVPNQHQCLAGHYCPRGTGIPEPCPSGTFSGSLGNTGPSNCRNCTAGKYCAGNGLEAPTADCNPSFYCPGGQATGSPSEYGCITGHRCPRGSPTPERCPSGYYQNEVLQSNCKVCPAGFYCNATYNGVVIPVLCEAGHFCPEGTGNYRDHPCPERTFSNVRGLMHTGNCTLCSPGHYCATPGLDSPTAPCWGGYFCTQGAQVPNPENDRLEPCKAGYYCPDGTPKPCGLGTYGNRTGLSSSDQCTDCPAGQFCSEAGLTMPKGPCAAGHFCEGGADSATPSPSSKYPRNGLCPVGHYCVEGTQTPEQCQPGTFRNTTGAAAFDHCLNCTPGWYCEGFGNSKPTDKCAPGYYCPENSQASVSEPCLPCVRGYYCRLGEITEQCMGGYFCKSGSPDPNPDGYWPPVEAGPCKMGHYCPKGTQAPLPCPDNT
ncbi:predicted protein, partial [Nematostella vectensis]